MPNKLQNEWRSSIIFILLIIMMLALFVSRALLSLSMISFVLVSFFHRDIKSHFKTFFSSPVLWGMSLLFLLPLISGIWSEDTAKWQDVLRIKLPLLALPLAFAGPVSISKLQWERLAYLFIAIIAGATAWSMFHYATNMQAVNESYLKAKTMITPLGNDHVRFSWLVAVAVLLGGWLVIKKYRSNPVVARVLIVITTWLIVFLHLLAARTGLFSFYIMLILFGGWLFTIKAKRKLAAILLLLFVAMPVTAYFIFPSFQNRTKYIWYDLPYFKKAHYLIGSSDAIRAISIKAGWNVMNEAPLTGAGFGDVMTETNRQYTIHYPEMYDFDKILPGSEWMMYGAGNGWPGFLLFSFVMLVPFFIKVKSKLPWWLLNITAAFSFIFDIGLEVQFGVFAYSFIVLCWWKWESR